MRRSTSMPWHHHPAHPGVVVPVRCDPGGGWGPTPGQARGPRWRRVGAGWYVAAHADPADTHQRIVEAAVRMPTHAGVTGWAALSWRGAPWFDGTQGRTALPVTLAVGCGEVAGCPGTAVSKERLLPDDVVVVDGLRVTTAVRSLLFEVRYAATLTAAVALLDMAAFGDLVSLAEAAAYAAQLTSCTGIPQARSALALADENAWSPTETAMRLAWEQVLGLPRPLTNRPVFDLAGRHVVTPDLIDVEHGLVGEYDGAVHLTRSGKTRDVERDATYRRLGLENVVMTADDLVDLDRFAARARAALSRSAARAGQPRAWTITPPRRWLPTTTVDERRALSPEDRRRLLGHRWTS